MGARVDLHSHYLPGIDDGVRTMDEGLRVLAGLAELGYGTVVATPHIRPPMFPNAKAELERAFAEARDIVASAPRMPQLALAAEHYCDDVFWDIFVRGEVLPYRGGRTLLVEFHYESWPQRIETRFFEMMVRGVRPVIAHPERYATLFRATDALDPLLDVGALTLLDVMSLAGRYGERSRRAAERMLEEGAYDAACTDVHRPDDIDTIARAIERLASLVGSEEAELLLATHPAEILDGTYDP